MKLAKKSSLTGKPIMNPKTFGFLGAGKMARALAGGLGRATPRPAFLGGLTASARTPATLDKFAAALGSARELFRPAADNRQLVQSSEVIILGIKPAQAAEVLPPLRDLAAGRLFISLLAGVPLARLQEHLGPEARLIRAMPNTPALIGEGITAYALGASATEADAALAQAVLQAVGQALRVEESQLDAVTALSGSGPAYVFHFLNALIAGGIAEGLPPETARTLALQTVLGAAKLVATTGESPLTLADQVKSPNGTTVAACNLLAERHWEETLRAAIAAARRRATELRQPPA